MTVYDVESRMNGWSYLRVTDGYKGYYTTEAGYEPLPENVGDAEVLSIAIDGNTLVLEI